MRSRSFLSEIDDWPTFRVKSMCWTTPSRRGVRLLQRREGLVEPVADVLVDLVEEVLPARLLGDEEGLGVEVRAVRPASSPAPAVLPLASSAATTLWRSSSNWSERPLQEEHPEDVLLELGGIHLAAEDVRGREEVAFELGEGELAEIRRRMIRSTFRHHVATDRAMAPPTETSEVPAWLARGARRVADAVGGAGCRPPLGSAAAR